MNMMMQTGDSIQLAKGMICDKTMEFFDCFLQKLGS